MFHRAPDIIYLNLVCNFFYEVTLRIMLTSKAFFFLRGAAGIMGMYFNFRVVLKNSNFN